MREQIDFSLTPDFRRFMDGLAGLENEAYAIVHGVFIDPHPALRAFQAVSAQAGIDDRQDSFFDMWFRNSPGWAIGASLLNAQIGTPFDPYNVPAAWSALCADSNKTESPFLVKIYVRPTTRKTSAQRRTVEAYARQQPFFATVLDAEQPSFVAKVDGSVLLTATIGGTLGGFLRDGSNIWGVTCGHVAQTTGNQITLDDVNNQVLNNAGTVQHSTFSPMPATCGALCNQYTQPNNLEVDAALIALSNPHTATNSVKSVGNITDIYDRTQLNSGSLLQMRGPRSGHNTYMVGGYGVTSKITLKGVGDFCFSHLFEFAAPSNSAGAVGGRIAQAISPRPLPGDSGSWLCFHLSGNDFAYFGNLIAVSGAMGIATFADSVQNWAKQPSLGISLTVL